MSEYTSVIKAMLAYFEMQPAELIAEWKLLTDEDKAEFGKMLTEIGYTFDTK